MKQFLLILILIVGTRVLAIAEPLEVPDGGRFCRVQPVDGQNTYEVSAVALGNLGALTLILSKPSGEGDDTFNIQHSKISSKDRLLTVWVDHPTPNILVRAEGEPVQSVTTFNLRRMARGNWRLVILDSRQTRAEIFDLSID